MQKKHKKPVYKYPDFIKNITLKKATKKRYWLNLEINNTKDENIIVILKNPSRADLKISDKTVYNVSNYIYRNREKYTELKNIGSITILNLMPNYETYSDQLKSLKSNIIDQENLKTINEFCKAHKKVIIAWGNHPSGLFNEYEILKSLTMNILDKNQNEVYYVDKMSKAENPKHGQVWGYENELVKHP